MDSTHSNMAYDHGKKGQIDKRVLAALERLDEHKRL